MSLREEIRELHAQTADLNKWKFLVVGTVAAAALGFVERAPKGSAYLLALLPFLALYADLLRADNDLKIFVKAGYIRVTTSSDLGDERGYESFHDRLRSAGVWWWFPGWVASFCSSVATSALVLLYGLLRSEGPMATLFCVSGGIGCASQVALWVGYQIVRRRIEVISHELIPDAVSAAREMAERFDVAAVARHAQSSWAQDSLDGDQASR